MADLGKYDILLNDLTAIESQISYMKKRFKALSEENRVLKDQLKSLQKENVELSEKIDNLKFELQDFDDSDGNKILDSLNIKEREDLKGKLQDLISKINYHLSANKQM